MLKKLALASVVASMSGVLYAQSVLGLPFGGQLDRPIPECEQPRAIPLSDYCSKFEELRPGRTKVDRMSLTFPREPNGFTVPSWVSARDSLYLSINAAGVIDLMLVPTGGPARQDSVISAVSERYGSPTSSVEREAQNAYGAKWTVRSATWDTSDVVVSFGCSDRVTCHLIFMTKDRHNAEQARIQERKQKDKL